MNQLIDIDQMLLQPFAGLAELDKNSQINTPILTVIDALILFCHATPNKKKDLINRLQKLKTDSGAQLVHELEDFDKSFVDPIYQQSVIELNLSKFDRTRHKQASKLTAQRLMPLFCLVIQDYQINVDTVVCEISAHALDDFNALVLKGSEQVEQINRMADQNDQYYKWQLSSFIRSSKHFSEHIDLLPKKQYRLTKISKLLDNMKELVEHYRSFLAYPSFQNFLLQCVADIGDEYNQLQIYINQLDTHLSHDEKLSRNLKDILEPMIKEIDSTIAGFNDAARLLDQKVRSPSFSREQKEILQAKISILETQYQDLFNKPTGIEELIEAQEDAIENDQVQIQRREYMPMAPIGAVPSCMVVSLTRLITKCQNSMSSYMRAGHKGNMLNELLLHLERKPNCSHDDVRLFVRELARIVMAPRHNYFFQANYGETSSANGLLEDIMKRQDDNDFPLAKLLFGNQHNVSLDSKTEVLSAMKGLATQHRWSKVASTLAPLAEVAQPAAILV